MIAESGTPEGFDAAAWLGTWLQQPCPALGNIVPATLLKTPGGYERVANIFTRMQSSAFS